MPFLILACEETGNRQPSDYEDLNGLYRGESTYTIQRSITDSSGNDTTISDTEVFFADSLRVSNANENTLDVRYQRIGIKHTLNRSTLSELSGTFEDSNLDSLQTLVYNLSINGDSLVGNIQLEYSAQTNAQYALELIKVE